MGDENGGMDMEMRHDGEIGRSAVSCDRKMSTQLR